MHGALGDRCEIAAAARLSLALTGCMAISASAVSSAADHAVRESAPWIEKLARLGFAAKALLYMTIGALAAAAALGKGGKTGTDTRGAMQTLLEQPFGRALVGVIAVGLFGYGVYRLIDGLKDAEHRGKGAKAIALRIAAISSGLIYLGLTYTAVQLAMGHYVQGGSDQKTQHWTARALATPGGQYALYGVAAAFVGYGIYQMYRAWKAKLGKQLSLGRMSWRSERVVIAISRFGIAARGVVFSMIGVLLFRAAHHRNPGEAGGIGKSMRELVEFGRWPFTAIAVGLIAYGIYQLINAKYRRLNAAG